MLKFAVDVKYGIKSSWQAAGPARGKWLNNKKKKNVLDDRNSLKAMFIHPFCLLAVSPIADT